MAWCFIIAMMYYQKGSGLGQQQYLALKRSTVSQNDHEMQNPIRRNTLWSFLLLLFWFDARCLDTGRVFSFYRTHDTNNNNPIHSIVVQVNFFLEDADVCYQKIKEFRGLACILSRLDSLATYYSYKTWFACRLMSPPKG